MRLIDFLCLLPTFMRPLGVDIGAASSEVEIPAAERRPSTEPKRCGAQGSDKNIEK